SLCWLAWAFLFFLRIWRWNRRADYLRLGLCAAAAVATKDQAYASLALLPVAIVVRNLPGRGARAWWKRVALSILDARGMAGCVVAVAAFAVFENLPFNRAGFAAHVRLIATWGGIALVERNAAGYLALVRITLSLFRLSLGWPLSLAALVGIASAVI